MKWKEICNIFAVYLCACVCEHKRTCDESPTDCVCALVQVAECESLDENVCEQSLLNEIFV